MNCEGDKRGTFQAINLRELVVLSVLKKLKDESGTTPIYILCQSNEDELISLVQAK